MGIRLHLDTVPREPVTATLRCKCSEVIVKSQGDTEKVRAKILIIKGNRVFAVCKKCNAEVPLPLEKAAPVAVEKGKPTQPDLGPPLILRK